MRRYVLIKSWHIVETVAEDAALTLCGRLVTIADRVLSDVIPHSEPSCESCLRIDERRQRT